MENKSRKAKAGVSDAGQTKISHPIIDMHCDLLYYLATVSDAHPGKTEDIGCAIPYLLEGNVKLQTLAIYSGGSNSYPDSAAGQCEWFKRLLSEYRDIFRPVTGIEARNDVFNSSGIGLAVAIENASALCGDNEPLEAAFRRLENIIKEIGPPVYISLTHHGENRFGGGNNSNAGLKDDGRVLLEYLDGKRIAVDLSHASDALAFGIIEHIDSRGLDLHLLASHSNFRSVYNSRRNLPDELATVITDRKGLIGMNLLRAYIHPDDPSVLAKHIEHGLTIGAEKALCFGNDYFYFKQHPDKSRIPFFFEEHENAGKYQQILHSLEGLLDPGQIDAMASGNALGFLQNLWSNKGMKADNI